MTEDELLNRIYYDCGPLVRDQVALLIETNRAACAEVVRLTSVVEEHAKALSRPLAERYVVGAQRIRDPDHPSDEANIRLIPSLHRVKLPWSPGNWSADHREAFVRETAGAIGLMVAKALAAEVWPPLWPVEGARP